MIKHTRAIVLISLRVILLLLFTFLHAEGGKVYIFSYENYTTILIKKYIDLQVNLILDTD